MPGRGFTHRRQRVGGRGQSDMHSRNDAIMNAENPTQPLGRSTSVTPRTVLASGHHPVLDTDQYLRTKTLARSEALPRARNTLWYNVFGFSCAVGAPSVNRTRMAGDDGSSRLTCEYGRLPAGLDPAVLNCWPALITLLQNWTQLGRPRNLAH